MSMITPREVAPEAWLDEATALHESGLVRFGHLDATDEVDRADEISVVLRVQTLDGVPEHLVTRVSRDGGTLPTLSGVWAAATWAEGAVAEGYGVTFDAHPDPRPVHQHPGNGASTHPLRKDHLLQQRQTTPWPGAKDDSGRGRRRQAAPGVADPAATDPADRIASAYGGRRR